MTERLAVRPFYGVVDRAGGGYVEVWVDRETMEYPQLGADVAVMERRHFDEMAEAIETLLFLSQSQGVEMLRRAIARELVV